MTAVLTVKTERKCIPSHLKKRCPIQARSQGFLLPGSTERERRVEERIWERSSVKLSRCGTNLSASKTCFVIQIASICSFKVLLHLKFIARRTFWLRRRPLKTKARLSSVLPGNTKCSVTLLHARWRQGGHQRKPAQFWCPGYFLSDARRARSREGIRFKWYYAMPRGHKQDPIYSLSINDAFWANFS